MLRRSLHRVLAPLISYSKSNSRKQNGRQYRQGQFYKSPKIFISASVLGWLGLKNEPEIVDPNHKASEELLKTIQLGVLTIQVFFSHKNLYFTFFI